MSGNQFVVLRIELLVEVFTAQVESSPAEQRTCDCLVLMEAVVLRNSCLTCLGHAQAMSTLNP